MNRPLRAVPDRPPQAIIYVRQSISRDDSVSLELQETAGRDHAARKGYEVVGVVADPGRSATTLKRRQVLATIERVERREVDVIILWRWSRLARNRRDFAVVCDTVESLGGRIESATEPIDTTTASGRFARGMMSEFAAYESELKGEVWQEIHERRWRLGKPAQGGPRFGYIFDPDTDTYSIDPTTGPFLKAMYEMAIAGRGYRAIAIWLNETGVPTVKGNRWTDIAARRILVSGFGAGKLARKARLAETRSWIDGVQPTVITGNQWLTYQQQVLQRMAPGQNREPRYYLSGFMQCGDCGKKMRIQAFGAKQAGYGYVCTTYLRSKQCRCISVSRKRAELVVDEFLAQVAGELDASGERAELAAEKRIEHRAEVADVTRRILRLDERLNRLTSGWTEGLVPDSAYRATRNEIEDLKRPLLVHLAQAEARVKRVPIVPVVPPGLLEFWDELPVENKREILRGLIDHVEVIRPPGTGRGRSKVRLVVVTIWGKRFDDMPHSEL